MKKTLVLVLFAFLLVSQSTQAKNPTTGYVTISEGVRSQTLKDEKGNVIGQRIEMQNSEVKGWFEAEKTSSGTFELTAKGLIQLETAEDKEKRKQNEGNC